jgi:hypothetical protein
MAVVALRPMKFMMSRAKVMRAVCFLNLDANFSPIDFTKYRVRAAYSTIHALIHEICGNPRLSFIAMYSHEDKPMV